ncbi:TET7 [Linum grandiflorum]
MACITKYLLGTLNIITFLISLLMFISITFMNHPHSQCDRSLQTPLVVITLFLTLVSLAGFLGICCRIRCLFLLYLSALLVLILVTVGFYVFAFVVSSIGHGRDVPGRAYKEYFLEDYTVWLRNRVSSRGKWSGIRSCLVESEACPVFNRSYGRYSVSEFYKARQSGCCKPPSECGFTYINPTNWTDTSAGRNQDCVIWNNDPSVLCYDCNSCKAAFLNTIKSGLRKSINVGIVFIAVLIVVYIFGYCAFRDQIWEGFNTVVGGADE